MGSLLVGGLVFVFLSMATSIGLVVRGRLPDHHLNAESKDVIRLATAVVGTLSALTLGLLIASAKSSYDNAEVEMRTAAARVLLLDRVMAQYGPETDKARQLMRELIERRLSRGWTAETTDETSGNAPGEYQDIEAVQAVLRSLLPRGSVQHSLQARALEVSGMMAEAHWLLVESGKEGLPWAFVTVLVCWLSLLFATFGLQAPANLTVLSILLVCALSVAGAIFLVSDMANPYVGLIRVSDAPLQSAIERLGEP
ncbi:membrane protein [Rhizobium leguminosarum]|uniref:bestrophin-like domain n=1 Tax=Rhizobium leguminosarum TaxID=384 RepID=UPI00040072B2|nr:membrane protein [Rhizobium leguminosarum]